MVSDGPVWRTSAISPHGHLARYTKLRVAHAPGMSGTFPRHRFQRKPLVSGPDMHHGTCATNVPWCMSGSLTRDGGENVPGIPGACATRNFTYLLRGPWINANVNVTESACIFLNDEVGNGNREFNVDTFGFICYKNRKMFHKISTFFPPRTILVSTMQATNSWGLSPENIRFVTEFR